MLLFRGCDTFQQVAVKLRKQWGHGAFQECLHELRESDLHPSRHLSDRRGSIGEDVAYRI
jgi:predicted HicB family RNase H-like nuclease